MNKIVIIFGNRVAAIQDRLILKASIGMETIHLMKSDMDLVMVRFLTAFVNIGEGDTLEWSL